MKNASLFILLLVLISCSRKSVTTVQENKSYSEETQFQFNGSSSEIDSSAGPLTRKILKRPNFASFASDKPFKVVYNICINQKGEVTYIRFAAAEGLADKGKIQQIAMKLQELSFKPDYNAPQKECGTYTIKMAGVQYQLR